MVSEPPKLVKAVQSFIEFYNFSALAQPLHNLTKKGAPFDWKKEQDDVFIKLKEVFLSALVVCMPDTTKPFLS